MWRYRVVYLGLGQPANPKIKKNEKLIKQIDIWFDQDGIWIPNIYSEENNSLFVIEIFLPFQKMFYQSIMFWTEQIGWLLEMYIFGFLTLLWNKKTLCTFLQNIQSMSLFWAFLHITMVLCCKNADPIPAKHISSSNCAKSFWVFADWNVLSIAIIKSKGTNFEKLLFTIDYISS